MGKGVLIMAWGNTDGPENGPEWHGPDRGTHSREGCAVAGICALLMMLAIGILVFV